MARIDESEKINKALKDGKFVLVNEYPYTSSTTGETIGINREIEATFNSRSEFTGELMPGRELLYPTNWVTQPERG